MSIWRNPPPLKITRVIKKTKQITPEDLAASGTEDGMQAALFCWASQSVGKYPQLKWMFSIPNGGSRHMVEAMNMVAAGVRSGVPDIFLPCAVMGENGWLNIGLFIEMKKEKYRKAKDGGCSAEQLAYMKWLCIDNNYAWRICYTWIEARDAIIKYLEGKL